MDVIMDSPGPAANVGHALSVDVLLDVDVWPAPIFQAYLTCLLMLAGHSHSQSS